MGSVRDMPPQAPFHTGSQSLLATTFDGSTGCPAKDEDGSSAAAASLAARLRASYHGGLAPVKKPSHWYLCVWWEE